MKTKFLLFPAFCLSFTLINAQTDLYNGGILKLSTPADILYISGNFTNTSTASLTNNGQLNVLRDLSNDEVSMNAGTGILFLNGSMVQTVSGAQALRTFDLVSNNSSGIVLNNNLSVSGTHTFINGIISTAGMSNYLIYETGSSYSGSGDTRHVNGWVKKIGNSNFTFPTGDGVYHRPAAIENLSANSEFNARYNAPTPNTFQTQLPLVSVDVYEYWEINKITGGTSLVRLNWDNTKVTFPCYNLSDVAVAHYNGSNWTDQGGIASGDPGIAGDVTSNSVSSFGNFVIGSKTFPLPLKFLSFTAQRRTEFINLNWVTAEEVNTDHFEIERSENGRQFSLLAKMPTINRVSVQEYSYKDDSYAGDVVYYRIRCVDRDGRSTLSKVIAVSGNSYLKKNIKVISPVADKIIIRSELDDKEPTAYALYNQAGSTILKGWLKLKVGMDNTIRLSFKPAKGVYFLKLIRANHEIIQKLVIN